MSSSRTSTQPKMCSIRFWLEGKPRRRALAWPERSSPAFRWRLMRLWRELSRIFRRRLRSLISLRHSESAAEPWHINSSMQACQATHGLVTHSRLLVAACLLEDSRLTIKQIARDTGYGKPDSLHLAMRKHAGIDPIEARTRGFARLLDIFAESFRQPSNVSDANIDRVIEAGV